MYLFALINTFKVVPIDLNCQKGKKNLNTRLFMFNIRVIDQITFINLVSHHLWMDAVMI